MATKVTFDPCLYLMNLKYDFQEYRLRGLVFRKEFTTLKKLRDSKQAELLYSRTKSQIWVAAEGPSDG